MLLAPETHTGISWHIRTAAGYLLQWWRCWGSEPCGVAALKADSVSTHQHLTPWIGGGMVAPQFRRHGIGARLLSALEDVARDLGFMTIYSGTSTANSLLIREGWQLTEIVQYDGESASIYAKAL